MRFDCEIIVSEIRNIGRVRSVLNGPAPVDDKLTPSTTLPPTDVPEEPTTALTATQIVENSFTIPTGPVQADGTFATDTPLPDSNGGFTDEELAAMAAEDLPSPAIPPLPATNNSYPKPTTGSISKDVTESVDPQYEAKVLEVIKENVSRYRYNLYECQFHVPAMPHPGALDQTTPLSPSDTHTIDISFKHSDMSFERFDYSTLKNPSGEYITLNNGLLVPTKVSTKDTQRAVIELEEDGKSTIRGLAGKVDFVRLDVISDNNQAGQDSIADTILGLMNSNDLLGDVKDIDKKDKFKGALKNAGKNLLKATKTAVTNEAQRQLNDRFRLLNNTIEKVKQAYGLGQISAPTNVYTNIKGGQPFYDVMNALRNFTGDVLGSALDLGG